MKLIKPNTTPGSWRVEGETVLSSRGELVATCPDVFIFADENDANAKAIAALPDLLKALECALDRINAANDHQREAGRMEYGTGDIIAALESAGYTIEP